MPTYERPGWADSRVRSSTSITRSRVASETEPPLMTRETVARETPVKAARSSSVPAKIPLLDPTMDGSALTIAPVRDLSRQCAAHT